MTISNEKINQLWDESITPALVDYIRIPNKSPQFDPNWKANGHMDKAVELIKNWCLEHAAKDMKLDVIEEDGRTPVILMDIPGQIDDTILLYGHLDKQPEMVGWDAGLGPWEPVINGDKLYGRGGADDGYAAFASLTAINTLQEQGIPHARCVIIIEASEESGSEDLPYYIDKLKDRIGTPSLVVCLDSGCGNYEQLWMTTSLRGLVGGTLTVETLKEGVHSGNGSGITPSCFRILRQLLDRIEDKSTGTITLDELHVDIPSDRLKQAKKAADVLQDGVFAEFPLLNGVQAEHTDKEELILRRTWKPALSVIGCDGLPSLEDAGNVALPKVAVKLSMRLAPTCSPEKAAKVIKDVLEKNPPYNAHVTYEVNDTGGGWNAPEQADWLVKAANDASSQFFGKGAMYMGEGGSIPFMGMLHEKFPEAQFMITGVLGPHSNAHGPNEFLHLPTAKKLTACVAHVVAEHAKK